MPELLEGVDRRTQLIGHNRLELLLFRLDGRQRFGINVFKVREVVLCPPLTHVPGTHELVVGITKLRNQTLPVIDLGLAMGQAPFASPDTGFVIVTEFNASVQGFLVGSVDMIANKPWEEIMPPPKGLDNGSYLTAVTRIDEELVEVIDVERVLAEVLGPLQELADAVDDGAVAEAGLPVLVVDDSAVARGQIERALGRVNVGCITARNGQEALDLLHGFADEGPIEARVSMVISDIEMPQMDGYRLTQEIRKDDRLSDLYVLLHSSLSGVLSQETTERVGANDYLSKFKPDLLVQKVLDKVAS